MSSGRVDRCLFDGTEYKIGERWHPFLPPFGYMACINCTCAEGALVRCEGEDCPKLACEHPQQREGKCCPVCTDNLPPEIHPWQDTPVHHQDCEYEGNLYRHNHAFLPTSNSLKPPPDGDCVLCLCLDGEVFCFTKTCPALECSRPVYVSEDCCPICEDPEQSASILDDMLASGFNIAHLNALPSENPDCKAGDMTYRNGSKWHPVVTPFGEMSCIICQCLEGAISCARMRCDPEVKCNLPKRVPGKCCPVCLNDNEDPSDIQSHEDNDLSPTENEVHRKCETPANDFLVRQTTLRRHFVLTFENEAMDSLHMYRWYSKFGRILEFSYRHLKGEKRTRLSKSLSNFTTSGWSKKKQASRFKSRIKVYMERCTTRRRGCYWAHILRRIRRLELRNAPSRTEC